MLSTLERQCLFGVNCEDINVVVNDASDITNYVIIIDDVTGEEIMVPILPTEQSDSISMDTMSNSEPLNPGTNSISSVDDEPETDCERGGSGQSSHRPGTENTKCNTRTRRKVANPSAWKRNVQKDNHAHGLEYLTARGNSNSKTVLAKSPQPCNCCRCRFHCMEQFSECTRQQLCADFYRLRDYLHRRLS